MPFLNNASDIKKPFSSKLKGFLIDAIADVVYKFYKVVFPLRFKTSNFLNEY
jgi:hypothetical protein